MIIRLNTFQARRLHLSSWSSALSSFVSFLHEMSVISVQNVFENVLQKSLALHQNLDYFLSMYELI